MECAEIKELLSEYIDGVLDKKTTGIIDEHLLTCQACQEEFVSLKSLIEALGSLESVEAPENFLEKLHERLEEPSKFRKVVRTLFVPGRIKIPLQFATAAAMAVLIFSILNIQQPEERLISLTEDSKDISTAEKTSMLYRSMPVHEETTAAQPIEKRKIVELALLLKAEEPSRAYPAKASIEAAPAPGEAERKRRVTPPATLDAEPTMEALGKKAQGQGLAVEEMATLKGQPQNSFKYSDDVFSRVRALIEHVNGKVLSVEYEKQTGRPETLHGEVPARQYRSFLEELAKIATLQKPPPELLEKGEEWIQIRIRFIPSS
jgi:hypothetical protein